MGWLFRYMRGVVDRDTSLPGTVKERRRKPLVCDGDSDRDGGAVIVLLLFVFVILNLVWATECSRNGFSSCLQKEKHKKHQWEWFFGWKYKPLAKHAKIVISKQPLLFNIAQAQGICSKLWPKSQFLIPLKNIFSLGFIYEVGVFRIYL